MKAVLFVITLLYWSSSTNSRPLNVSTKVDIRDPQDRERCLDHCEQACVFTNYRLLCRCVHGYTLNKDGRTCDDVDECQKSWPCHQKCINMVGTYKCGCDEGYELDDDNVHCSDVNECTFKLVCRGTPGSTCVNLPGTYLCIPGIDSEQESNLEDQEDDVTDNEAAEDMLIRGDNFEDAKDDKPFCMDSVGLAVTTCVLLGLVAILIICLTSFIIFGLRKRRQSAAENNSISDEDQKRSSHALHSISGSDRGNSVGMRQNRTPRKKPDRHFFNYFTIEPRKNRNDDDDDDGATSV